MSFILELITLYYIDMSAKFVLVIIFILTKQSLIILILEYYVEFPGQSSFFFIIMKRNGFKLSDPCKQL